MTCLVFRLTGPAQSWGVGDLFGRRSTGHRPTKSAIIGLLAAALGRRRGDVIDDLAGLRFGVRTEQAGRVVRDFHTATRQGGGNAELQEKFYLCDAVFLIIIEGPEPVLGNLYEAIRRPRYAMYLGRKACIPEPIIPVLTAGTMPELLKSWPWSGSADMPRPRSLPFARDISEDESAELAELEADQPASFEPRRHQIRPVITGQIRSVDVRGPRTSCNHDPMALAQGFACG